MIAVAIPIASMHATKEHAAEVAAAAAELVDEETAERISEMLGQVKQAMDKGGDNKLARQINNYRLSAKEANLDTLSRHRLEKLNATLKEIATRLRD